MAGAMVLGLVLVAMPMAFAGVRKQNAETETFVRASALVAAGLEDFRTHEYSDLLADVGHPDTETVKHPTRDNIVFTVVSSISQGTGDYEGMLKAEVAASWTENKRQREFKGATVFSEDGLSDKKFDDGN